MADVVFKQCLDAVQDGIRGLDLSGIKSNVLLRKVPFDKDAKFPAVFVYPLPERINPTAGTNLRDQIEYGVGVTIARVSKNDLTEFFNTMLKWREQIRSKFIHQRLSGVTEVNTCRVEPGEVVLPAAIVKLHEVGFLVVRCMAWETRG